jgi:hypothetical protein
VDGFRSGGLGGQEDRRRVEIAPGRQGRPDADREVRMADVGGVAVGLRMGRDRAQAQHSAGPLDAERDLAAVGD